jgi:hypothetical protein
MASAAIYVDAELGVDLVVFRFANAVDFRDKQLRHLDSPAYRSGPSTRAARALLIDAVSRARRA